MELIHNTIKNDGTQTPTHNIEGYVNGHYNLDGPLVSPYLAKLSLLRNCLHTNVLLVEHIIKQDNLVKQAFKTSREGTLEERMKGTIEQYIKRKNKERRSRQIHKPSMNFLLGSYHVVLIFLRINQRYLVSVFSLHVINTRYCFNSVKIKPSDAVGIIQKPTMPMVLGYALGLPEK